MLKRAKDHKDGQWTKKTNKKSEYWGDKRYLGLRRITGRKESKLRNEWWGQWWKDI